MGGPRRAAHRRARLTRLPSFRRTIQPPTHTRPLEDTMSHLIIGLAVTVVVCLVVKFGGDALKKRRG
ncbi:hypothetical protein GCM10010331_67990 [Streptomyces xanthochromogenes]|uniref:Uncharacterized protein n=1 Tax=Streptomyces xanthochromogenes TaxID=67384 RepID=A0ABQ2ZRH1_9ACTN|nr:hypothetical protein GCM10010326_15950 [Streptomyces xanthochromogenes]GHB70392.1 hypothetical protein GCM10010331_67990 [Streptomyces xanthochromogenes]